MSQFKYVVPPSIAKIPEALEEFQRVMEEIRKGYRRIKDILQAHGLNSERANEDARFLLPQAVETKIIVTMNVRELLHFFSERLCSRAQWEIRELAKRMLEECKKVLPAIFEEVGPKCVILGYCPENQQSCGFYLSRNL
jgi:thymidylate synthase (FAD)